MIATHEHWDHLSGFVQAKQSFDRLKVGQVWLAWTENPDDELTKKLKKEKGLALSALRMGLSQMQMAGDSDGVAELSGILEFFGVAKGPTTADALNNVRAKTAKPRYCLPTDPPIQSGGDQCTLLRAWTALMTRRCCARSTRRRATRKPMV